MSIEQRQKRIVEQFAGLEDWELRYKQIIALGKELPELPVEHKIDKNLVRGCQSQVWLVAEQGSDGRVHLQADSDAVIVRGLVYLLLQVYSGATPQEILATPADFIEKLGFKQNLSPSRTNGLASMLKQIKLYAMAFHSLNSASGQSPSE